MSVLGEKTCFTSRTDSSMGLLGIASLSDFSDLDLGHLQDEVNMANYSQLKKSEPIKSTLASDFGLDSKLLQTCISLTSFNASDSSSVRLSKSDSTSFSGSGSWRLEDALCNQGEFGGVQNSAHNEILGEAWDALPERRSDEFVKDTELGINDSDFLNDDEGQKLLEKDGQFWESMEYPDFNNKTQSICKSENMFQSNLSNYFQKLSEEVGHLDASLHPEHPRKTLMFEENTKTSSRMPGGPVAAETHQMSESGNSKYVQRDNESIHIEKSVLSITGINRILDNMSSKDNTAKFGEVFLNACQIESNKGAVKERSHHTITSLGRNSVCEELQYSQPLVPYVTGDPVALDKIHRAQCLPLEKTKTVYNLANDIGPPATPLSKGYAQCNLSVVSENCVWSQDDLPRGVKTKMLKQAVLNMSDIKEKTMGSDSIIHLTSTPFAEASKYQRCKDIQSFREETNGTSSSSDDEWMKKKSLKTPKRFIPRQGTGVVVGKKIEYKSCVLGLKTIQSTTLSNTTDYTQHLTLKLQQLTVNKRNYSTTLNSIAEIQYPLQLVLSPRANISIQVCLTPYLPGTIEARLDVYCSSNESRLGIVSCCIQMKASVFTPEVKAFVNGEFNEECSRVDIGLVPIGCTKSVTLMLINPASIEIPVKFTLKPIPSNSQCYFTFNPLNGYAGCIKIKSPFSAVGTLPPTEPTILCLNFNVLEGMLSGDLHDVQALLEIDLSTSSQMVSTLKTIKLISSVGWCKPQIEEFSSNETILSKGDIATKCITIVNKGNISMDLHLGIQETEIGEMHFMVTSPSLRIDPLDSKPVVILFVPRQKREAEGLLIMTIEPNGQKFEYPLKGRVMTQDSLRDKEGSQYRSSQGSKAGLTRNSTTESGVFSLNSRADKSDKVIKCQEIKIDSSIQSAILNASISKGSCNQRISLANKTNKPVPVTLELKDAECFTIIKVDKSSLPPNSRVYDTVIKSNSFIDVVIGFEPSSELPAQSQLFIRPKVRDLQQKTIKFTIPVLGYIGSSRVINNCSMNGILLHYHEGEKGYTGSMILENKGQMAAFVNILATLDQGMCERASDDQLKVLPDKFVLNAGCSQQVKVTLFGDMRHYCLLVTWGDELLRTIYRRNPRKACKKNIKSPAVLQEMDFSTSYLNESIEYNLKVEGISISDYFWSRLSNERVMLIVNPTKDSDLTTNMLTLLPEETRCCFDKSATPSFADDLTQNKWLFLPHTVTFDCTKLGFPRKEKLKISNFSNQDFWVMCQGLQTPFKMTKKKLCVKANSYLSVPIYFDPCEDGAVSRILTVVCVSNDKKYYVNVVGEAVL